LDWFRATFEGARINEFTGEGEKIAYTFLHSLVEGERRCLPSEDVKRRKGTRLLISALWARSNAAPDQNNFQKISPGEFSKTAAMHRGCGFHGYPLYP